MLAIAVWMAAFIRKCKMQLEYALPCSRIAVSTAQES